MLRFSICAFKKAIVLFKHNKASSVLKLNWYSWTISLFTSWKNRLLTWTCSSCNLSLNALPCLGKEYALPSDMKVAGNSGLKCSTTEAYTSRGSSRQSFLPRTVRATVLTKNFKNKLSVYSEDTWLKSTGAQYEMKPDRFSVGTLGGSRSSFACKGLVCKARCCPAFYPPAESPPIIRLE